MNRRFETALTNTEFEELLVSPRFIQRIRKVANFTLNTFLEGGFAVYKSGDGVLRYSGVIMSGQDDLMVSRDEQGNVRVLGESIDLTPLAVNGLDAGYRTDLAILLHSHPSLSRRLGAGKKMDPFPSLSDLAMHEKLQTANPALIEAILGANKQLGEIALLFYGLTKPADYQPTVLQTLDENSGPTEILRRVRQSGMGIARATYSLQPTKLLDDPAQVSAGLFA